MFKLKAIGVVLASAFILSGCAATGEEHAADVYDIDQLNSQQETSTVQILSIGKAKVKVDNIQQKKTAQTAGAVLGAIAGGVASYNLGGNSLLGVAAGGAVGGVAGGAAGGLVKDKVLVDAVTLSYKNGTKIYSSVQVGRDCQFKLGLAMIVTTKDKETRIQPNAECPKD